MNAKKVNPIFGSLGLLISGIAGIIYGLFTTFSMIALIICLIMIIAGSILLSLAFIGKSPNWNMDVYGDNIFSLIIIYLLSIFMTYLFFQSFQFPPDWAFLSIPTTLFPLMLWCWYMTVFFTLIYFYKPY